MKQIQKGKKPKVNIGSELDDAQAGFKVTLQKPSKIKSGLDNYVIGQENAKGKAKSRSADRHKQVEYQVKFQMIPYIVF